MRNFNTGNSRYGGGGGGGGRGRDRDRGRDSGDNVMHSAVCGECGRDCQVPFKPTGNRPVLCSNCFEKSGGGESRSFGSDRRGGGERRGGFGGRGNDRSSGSDRRSGRDARRSGNEAVCDDCRRNCIVPFKPEAGKPVYCDDCFPKHSKNGSDKVAPVGVDYSKQLKELTSKVDQILDILNAAMTAEDEIIEEIEEVLEEIEAPAEIIDLAVDADVEVTPKKKKAAKKTSESKKSAEVTEKIVKEKTKKAKKSKE